VFKEEDGGGRVMASTDDDRILCFQELPRQPDETKGDVASCPTLSSRCAIALNAQCTDKAQLNSTGNQN